jgi:hypothetical protein
MGGRKNAGSQFVKSKSAKIICQKETAFGQISIG